ncbi:MAG: hypothetical protein IJK04_08985, partial [Kiritimatiellae bacterium]|nr:hypothetical protein [Kiritimatiellia bacterium]
MSIIKGSPTEKGLNEVFTSNLQTSMGYFLKFPIPPKGGFPIRRGEESPARGWGKAPLAAGNLFTGPP